MRSKLLVTASVPCAYYFYSSTRSQSCLMEGEESPLHRMQKQIDDSGLPISLTNNFSLNLIAGGAIVMYWGAMWNILDRYFLVKRIPNPTANSVLRIVVGLGILAYVEISFFFRAHNYTHTHTHTTDSKITISRRLVTSGMVWRMRRRTTKMQKMLFKNRILDHWSARVYFWLP